MTAPVSCFLSPASLPALIKLKRCAVKLHTQRGKLPCPGLHLAN